MEVDTLDLRPGNASAMGESQSSTRGALVEEPHLGVASPRLRHRPEQIPGRHPSSRMSCGLHLLAVYVIYGKVISRPVMSMTTRKI